PSPPSAARATGADASASRSSCACRAHRPSRLLRGRRTCQERMAGAPGFEPGITGPKPVALPLGHAPSGPGILATVQEEIDEPDDREDDDGRDHGPLHDPRED